MGGRGSEIGSYNRIMAFATRECSLISTEIDVPSGHRAGPVRAASVLFSRIAITLNDLLSRIDGAIAAVTGRR